MWHVVSHSGDDHLAGKSGYLNVADVLLAAHRAVVSKCWWASCGGASVGGEDGAELVVALGEFRLLVLLDPLLKIREPFLRNRLVQQMIHAVGMVFLHEISHEAQMIVCTSDRTGWAAKDDINLWHFVTHSFNNHLAGKSGYLNVADVFLAAHRAAVYESGWASVFGARVGGEGGSVLVVALGEDHC